MNGCIGATATTPLLTLPDVQVRRMCLAYGCTTTEPADVHLLEPSGVPGVATYAGASYHPACLLRMARHYPESVFGNRRPEVSA
jgi:hypothetical protein